jgi:hypothetical protein
MSQADRFHGKQMENNREGISRSAAMKEKKTSEFVGAIIGAIIGIIFVNSVPAWQYRTNGVILVTWVNILWAANLSMIVQILGNLALAIYRPARLYSFLQAIIAFVGLGSTIVFYWVFPLDFSQIVGNWLNILVRVLMVIGMVGSLIAIGVHLVRTILGTPYKRGVIT